MNINFNRKVNTGTSQLFLFFFALYVISTTIAMSTYNDSIGLVLTILRYISYVVFMMVILTFSKAKKRIILIYALLIIFSFLVSIRTGDNKVFCILLLLIASTKTDIKKIFFVGLWSKMISVLFVIVSFFLEIIPENTNYRLWQTRIRHSLGFEFSNNLSVYYFFILAVYIVYKNNNIKKREYVLFLILNYIINVLTDSNASYVLVYLLVLFSVLSRTTRKIRWNKHRKMFCIIGSLLFIIPVALPLLNKNDPFFVFLNAKIFHNRLLLTTNAIKYYGLSLFGREKIAHTINSEIMVDSGTFGMFIFGGIIFYIFFYICFIKMLSYYTKKETIHISFIIILTLLQGVFESFIFDISSNYLLFLIPEIIAYTISRRNVLKA